MANHNIAMSLTESPATQSFHTVWFVNSTAAHAEAAFAESLAG